MTPLSGTFIVNGIGENVQVFQALSVETIRHVYPAALVIFAVYDVHAVEAVRYVVPHCST